MFVEEYWANVSETARDFVTECLTIDPASRPTAAEALKHKWLASEQPHFVQSPTGGPTNLLPQIQKAFDAKKTFRKAVFSMIATKRMSTLAGLSPTAQNFGHNIAQLKEESEKEHVDSEHHVQHFDGEEAQSLKNQDDAASPEARTVSGDGSQFGSGSGTESRSQATLPGIQDMTLENKEK